MKNLLIILGFVVVVGICGAVASGHSDDAAAKPEVASVPAANPSRAAECKKALQSVARKTGLWRSYQTDSGGITAVEVGDIYYGTTFDQKEALNGMMLCVLTDGREGSAADLKVGSVQYLDSHTHKTIAIWTPFSGFSVD